MILLFSLIIELMAKREERCNTPYLNSALLILMLIERLALNMHFMYNTVLDLIHSVLQKCVPLSSVTQRDVKLYVF